MMKKKEYSFTVNGLEITAEYFESNINLIFIPLLEKLNQLYRQKGSRLIVYFAAPPGTGKTTLVQFLEFLSGSMEGMATVQAIGLDGFHYPQSYLASHQITVDGKTIPMNAVKGCPETFDIDHVKKCVRLLQKDDIKWPIYDRILHDVIPNAFLVTKEIILIEGNWFLLDENGWRDLAQYCDYSVFITAEEELLKKRLIARKIKGGMSEDKALAFYEESDGKNIRRALDFRLKPDLLLHLKENGEYFVKGE